MAAYTLPCPCKIKFKSNSFPGHYYYFEQYRVYSTNDFLDQKLFLFHFCNLYFVQVSKMKVKRCSSVDIEVYKLDVWIRGAAGERKLSLLVRKEDQEKDRECLIYKTVIEDIRKYLAAKPDVNRKYLPISEAFDCHNGGSNSDNNDEDNYTDFFIIEDIKVGLSELVEFCPVIG